MKSESLNDPNSTTSRLENGTPKPPTNGGEGDADLKAEGKPPRASDKRLIQRAAAETEVLPVTQPYLISPRSMNADYQGPADESFGSAIRATLLLLREKPRLIILCVLLAVIAGVTYNIRRPPFYQAEAVIRVEMGDQRVLKADEEGVYHDGYDEVIKTTEQTLTSPQLLLQLVKRNALDKDPAFLPELKRPASDNRVVEELAKQVFVHVRHGTWLIDIRVQDRSPVLAQKIAELLIREYANENFQQHTEESEIAYNFLREKAQRLRAKLVNSEEALQAYKEQCGASDLGEKESTIPEKLRILNRLVADAKANRLKLEADYGQIKKLGRNSPTDLLAIPAIASSAPVIALEKAVSEKEAEVAALAETYKHPIHTGAIKQLQQLRESLDRTVLQAAQEVTNAYDSAAANEKKMEDALREQDFAALQSSKLSISYDVLRQEVDSDRALYESVLNRSKETDAAKDAVRDAISVISRPLLPDRPVNPHKWRILLICFLGGSTLGCGLAFLSRTLDRSFRTPDEAERGLGVPVLGVIPKCARPKWLTDDLLLLERPGSGTAESFRNLRTSLSLLEKNSGHKTFLFTSAGISEGKSFCAVNCAVAFAQQGLKTLLIDADLRSPSMDGIFFDEAPVQGLTEILTDQTELDHAVRLTNINKLFVLCAGRQLDSPAELLAGERFGQLMRETTAKFDCVVVDSAPVHPVSDTLLLVRHVQATCLIVSSRAPAEVVFQAARKLCNAGSTLAGFIFNRVSRHQGTDYLYRPYPVLQD
jgi:capsular exopolysaccharide synthesis family protein